MLARPLPAALALAAALAVALPLRAQAPSGPVTFEAEVLSVSLTAVVRDRTGRFVGGLGPGDVEVLEDGVRQELLYFREAAAPGADPIPLAVVLVLDASGSMKRNLGFLQEAALAFVNRLAEGDRVLLVDFNSSLRTSAEFTADHARLEQSIEGLQAWGGTSLNDAIHHALNRVREEPGRKAVVVFSDGADTTSTLREREVVDYARAVEATVYCVGIRGESGLFARSPRGFLRRIAQETGGDFFFPEKVGELSRVFRGISEELQNHYALAYSPRRPADGGWRAIEVRPRRPELQVRARQGYFAVRRPARRPAG